ncbi:T9SS type A sorting domain-containing protein [Bacteroidota bacterium]
MNRSIRFLICLSLVFGYVPLNAQINAEWDWISDEPVYLGKMATNQDTVYVASLYDFDGITYFPMMSKLDNKGQLIWSTILFDYIVFDYTLPGVIIDSLGQSYMALNTWDNEINDEIVLILTFNNKGEEISSQKITGEDARCIHMSAFPGYGNLMVVTKRDSVYFMILHPESNTTATVNSIKKFEFYNSNLAIDAEGNYYFSANNQLWKFDSAHTELWKKELDQNILSLTIQNDTTIIINTGTYTPGSNWVYSTAQLSSYGNINWIDTFKNAANSICDLIAITGDNDGNVIACGLDRTNIVNHKIITRKYDPNGQIIWSSIYDTHLVSPFVNKVLTDPFGNIFVSANISENEKFYHALMVYDKSGKIVIDTLDQLEEFIEVRDVRLINTNQLLIFGKLSGKAFLKDYSYTLKTYEVTIEQVICAGGTNGSVTLYPSFGTAPYIYVWEDPVSSTNQYASRLWAGTYYKFSITDAMGQTIADSIILHEPDPITLEIDTTSITCFNWQNGEARIHISGGTPPYTCLWDGNAINADSTIENLASDILFRLEVMDENQCTCTDSIILFNPPEIAVDTILGKQNVNPYEVASYSVSGHTDIVYEWMVEGGNLLNGQGSSLIDIQWGESGPGNISVSASDTNNCPGDTSLLDVTILSTNLNQKINKSVHIFPNPFQQLVHIQLPAGTFDIGILDIWGRSVFEIRNVKEREYIIDTKNLLPGIYFLKINDSQLSSNKMIIKE